MEQKETALVLIGYQNDYFSADGLLYGMIEDSSRVITVLSNTVDLIERLLSSEVTIINTPIIFTTDYSEIVEHVGILNTIKKLGAFKARSKGAETIAELLRFGDRIIEVPGKRGLNAFSNTQLNELLQKWGIKNVVLAGVATSLCIDSTGRSAYEHGYKVSILSDCTSGRTSLEQAFYCEQIFPLYANVMAYNQFLKAMNINGDES